MNNSTSKGFRAKLPGTSFTPEQLCRVKSQPTLTVWEPGMIVTTDGAHQRRHLVVSVTNLGVQNSQYLSGKRQVYAVVLRHLGYFYADNRYELSRQRRDAQHLMNVLPGEEPHGNLGSYRLVTPVGDTKPVRLAVKKSSWVSAALGSPHGASSPPKKPSPPPSPEAVLDSFRVKPITAVTETPLTGTQSAPSHDELDLPCTDPALTDPEGWTYTPLNPSAQPADFHPPEED